MSSVTPVMVDPAFAKTSAMMKFPTVGVTAKGCEAADARVGGGLIFRTCAPETREVIVMGTLKNFEGSWIEVAVRTTVPSDGAVAGAV